MKRCNGPLCQGALRPLDEFAADGAGHQAYCHACKRKATELARERKAAIRETDATQMTLDD